MLRHLNPHQPIFGALFPALLIAGPALAQQEPTEAQREAFIAAVKANGCRMTEQQAPDLLPSVGIDQETSAAIVNDLVTEGLAELNRDRELLILKTEGCAP
ncbi:hypothetical protein [Tabrizicola sp.]|uniref:hypothetical protein n=1 Tax=Tabrizicola sp. TaxID=2005166 RepID=UPI003F381AB7